MTGSTGQRAIRKQHSPTDGIPLGTRVSQQTLSRLLTQLIRQPLGTMGFDNQPNQQHGQADTSHSSSPSQLWLHAIPS
jgi:hypothetical protein